MNDTPQAADEALKAALAAFLATRLPALPEESDADERRDDVPGTAAPASADAAPPPPTVLLVSDDRGFAPSLRLAAARGARCVAVSTAPPAPQPGVEHVPWAEVLEIAGAGMYEDDDDDDYDDVVDPYEDYSED